jgi:predicted HicB family RNase H-like nuclease
MPSRRTWEPHELEILRREWLSNVQIKAIAHAVNHPPSSIQAKRKELGLPPRNSMGRTHMKVQIETSLINKAKVRAQSSGKSFSGYVRSLILQDLGRI